MDPDLENVIRQALGVAKAAGRDHPSQAVELLTLIEDRSGATAIEYGLIAALVSVAGVTAFDFLGSSLSGIFDLVANAVADAADVTDNVRRCVEVESNCVSN